MVGALINVTIKATATEAEFLFLYDDYLMKHLRLNDCFAGEEKKRSCFVFFGDAFTRLSYFSPV
jgi:hypothetical protein